MPVRPVEPMTRIQALGQIVGQSLRPWSDRLCAASVWGKAIQARTLIVVLLATSLLTGCVRYDVGVNFDSQTHGTIVQQIRLSERLTSFSQATVQDWLNSIEHRARQLQGNAKRMPDRGLVVTIPFNNGEELVDKFDRFFNPVEEGNAPAELDEELPQLESHLDLTQNNALFVLRNRLSLDLDLRSLGALVNQGNFVVSPESVLDLSFTLNTPWGAKPVAPKLENLAENEGDETVIEPADEIAPEVATAGQQLVWKLQPGEVNHLEVVFWVPSPIGIGSLVIIALVVLGNYLKHQLLPKWGLDRQSRPKSRTA
jgi:Protein of unknown function (DUF3153)